MKARHTQATIRQARRTDIMPRVTKHDLMIKQNRALALRRTGATYDDIAAALGYRSAASAWKIVNSALTKIQREHGEAILELELDRTDRLQRAVWQNAVRGDDKSINTILRLMEHRAKLTKLYDATPSGDHDAIKAAFAGLLSAAIDHPLAHLEPPGAAELLGHGGASQPDLQAPETPPEGVPGA